MKKLTVPVVAILCALMLVVGFAPSYVDFIGLPNVDVAGVEEIFLPPVAAAEMPVLPEVPLASMPNISNDSYCVECLCGPDCACCENNKL